MDLFLPALLTLQTKLKPARLFRLSEKAMPDARGGAIHLIYSIGKTGMFHKVRHGFIVGVAANLWL